MKYSDWKSFEKHLQSAAPQHLSPIYLIIGKDDFLKKMAEETLSNLISQQCHIARFDAQDIDSKLIDNELNGMDLFSKRKALFLFNSEKISKPCAEILQNYFPKASSALPIVLIATSINANTNLYKKGEKFGVVFNAETPKTKDLESICENWLILAASKLGKKLPPNSARLLYTHLGPDYNALLNELEKLSLYVGDSQTIDEKDIVELVKAIPQATAWQAGEAILQGHAAEALDLCHKLLDTGTNVISLIRQLRYTFQTSFDLLSMPPEQIPQFYPHLRGFVLDKKLQLARQYSADHFKSAIIALDTSEFAAKDAMGDDELIMEKLLIKLIAGLPSPLNTK